MLKDVLSPDDCARCGFCCSFRRQSLHLTPLFAAETVAEIRRLHPEARFRELPNGATTIDIGDRYRTDDDREEAMALIERLKMGGAEASRLDPWESEAASAPQRGEDPAGAYPRWPYNRRSGRLCCG